VTTGIRAETLETRVIAESERVPDFEQFGILAFTTTRALGSFGLMSEEPVRDVMGRWHALRDALSAGGKRFATATQVHETHVILHQPGWEGWLRGNAADGHASIERGTGMAVTVADCVPVFVAHPSGATALLHSGWRGTAGRIVEKGIAALAAHGLSPRDMLVHLGPAICGKCYEVSADVYAQLTGTNPGKPKTVDLRALIAEHARGMGVTSITASSLCTLCDHDRFYSHRAGDVGRQLGVMIADL